MSNHPLHQSQRNHVAAHSEARRSAHTVAPPFWRSLRVRIPLLFGAIILVVLATFLWAMHAEVEDTLVTTGAAHAQFAANEIATTLSEAIGGAQRSGAEFGVDPALQEALRNPGESRLAAARAVLQPSPGLRRVELWSAGGVRVLEIVSAPTDTGRVLRSFPAHAAPTAAGVSDILTEQEFPYFHITSDVRADDRPNAPVLGYVRRYGRLTSSGSVRVSSLLGEDAVLKVGRWGHPEWTDLMRRTDPAPQPDSAAGPGEYRNPDRERWVGASAPVSGTPWIVWVGYPRKTVVEPLQAFLDRMLFAGALFVIGGCVVGGALSMRITRPLHRLAGAAEQVAGGDYTPRVEIDRRDELGRLSAAFNTMTGRIDEAHRALRDANQLTHFALASARIGVWESDLGNGGIACSDSMALVHGFTDSDELPATRAAFLELVHADDREAVRAMLESRSPEAGVFDVQYRALWPDGSVHWIEGKGRVKLDDAGRAVSVLGVSIDVTDRLRLESQLRQSQKMEAVGQLAGGVAHDFNNVLTAIVGHGNMLLSELPEQSHAREDVAEILNAADSAARLTRQLLTFSRRSVLQPDVVDINDVVARTDGLLRRLIPAHVEVVTRLTPDAGAVRVDVAQLQQVIVNLAVNARDAMPGGGTLTIATGTTELDGSTRFGADAPAAGRYAVLTVADTGTGMDAETQSHLFEPFFTTKPAGQGTGLGLATVFGIITQSGGHISVESEPGAGTTFRICLPVVEAANTRTPAPQAPPRAIGGNEVVLVVDDDAPVRTIARKILQRLGYDVRTASSGEEALMLVSTKQVQPDLVITDIVMPGMTGTELYDALVMSRPNLRVLFTSGYAAESLGRYGVETGGAPFIEKPYSPEELAVKVRAALDPAP